MAAYYASQTTWNSPLDAFENAYQHEHLVTSWIYELVDLAIAERDHATNSLLQWFVNEQVEEEANTSMIVDKLKLIGNNSQVLFMMDTELGTRTLEAAPAEWFFFTLCILLSIFKSTVGLTLRLIAL